MPPLAANVIDNQAAVLMDNVTLSANTVSNWFYTPMHSLVSFVCNSPSADGSGSWQAEVSEDGDTVLTEGSAITVTANTVSEEGIKIESHGYCYARVKFVHSAGSRQGTVKARRKGRG